VALVIVGIVVSLTVVGVVVGVPLIKARTCYHRDLLLLRITRGKV
jgi:hypothetical protein